MSATTHPAAAPGAPFLVMLRGALIPSVATGVVIALVLGLLRGTGGAVSGAIGAAVALAFFASGMFLLGNLVHSANRKTFLAVAMTVYLCQIVGLLLVVVLVRNADWVDRKAMGVAVGVVTIMWQLFAIRSARSARIPIFDVDTSLSTQDRS